MLTTMTTIRMKQQMRMMMTIRMILHSMKLWVLQNYIFLYLLFQNSSMNRLIVLSVCWYLNVCSFFLYLLCFVCFLCCLYRFQKRSNALNDNANQNVPTINEDTVQTSVPEPERNQVPVTTTVRSTEGVVTGDTLKDQMDELVRNYNKLAESLDVPKVEEVVDVPDTIAVQANEVGMNSAWDWNGLWFTEDGCLIKAWWLIWNPWLRSCDYSVELKTHLEKINWRSFIFGQLWVL